MGSQVSINLKNSLLLDQTPSKKKDISNTKAKETIGILSFEVANVMSKLTYLYKSVKKEVIKSEGVKKLVSSDDCFLLELAYAERLDDLNRAAEVVSRLGKKCTEPALQGFEHVYEDLTNGKIEFRDVGFLVRDMEGMVRKMERYVDATAHLYRELEALSELERTRNKSKLNQNLLKLSRQRQDVKHLKEISLWSHTYDKVVELLARTVCTVYTAICIDEKQRQVCCLNKFATMSTVGGSGLALHYANVVIAIEKLLCFGQLVGKEAREDLYLMLPTSLRELTRTNLILHSNSKHVAIYDWSETLDGILKWLAPLAHNMIRWQSERNFGRQQQIVTKTNVLLLQTLYFADRDKTEAVISELLVGLNYVCRYEQQQRALLDCVTCKQFRS